MTEESNLLMHATVNQGRFLIKMYDTDNEYGRESSFNYKLFKSKAGLSIYNYNNNLYFCGIESEAHSNGSYFFSCSLNSFGTPNYLINSNYPHYEPSMVGWEQNNIIVIGGKNSRHCEMVSVKNSKWKSLPKLPEERFGCSLLIHSKAKMLYLFGGENSKTGKVLRLNLKIKTKWDTFTPRETEPFTRRNAFVMAYGDIFLVLGGTVEGEKQEKVFELNLPSLETKEYLGETLPDADFTFAQYNSIKDKLFYFDTEGEICALNPLSMDTEKLDFYSEI